MWWMAWTMEARATWSVVASDAATGQIGGAGTSCVGGLDLRILFGGAPGFGAIHAQALINTEGRDLGAQLLTKGTTPEDVIAAITDPGFDPSAALRQYGVVDLLGNAAAYTGAQNGDWAGHRTGVDGTFTYSVQGNILTGAEVVERTQEGFLDPASCDLAERLMVGLESGAAPGEGDSRCTPSGIPSDSAFLAVVDQYGAPVVRLTVTDTSPNDPLLLLRSGFDEWRAKAPCPPPPPPDTTPPPTGDTGSPLSSGTTTPAAPDPPSPAPTAEASAGCGCSGGGGGPHLLLAPVLLWGWRRSRRAA